MTSLQVAFSAEGAPTKALEGFCKKNGITPEDVSRQADAKGVDYVWATVRQPKQSAAQVGTVQGRPVDNWQALGAACLTAQHTACSACVVQGLQLVSEFTSKQSYLHCAFFWLLSLSLQAQGGQEKELPVQQWSPSPSALPAIKQA